MGNGCCLADPVQRRCLHGYCCLIESFGFIRQTLPLALAIFILNSRAYPTASHESSPAWEWICISTGCPARGEAPAFVINAEAEGREDLQPQEG